jgi:hypothetical protein
MPSDKPAKQTQKMVTILVTAEHADHKFVGGHSFANGG